MTPALLKIVRLLGELGPGELDDLLARIKALQQFGSATPLMQPVESDEAFVLGCIGELFVSLGAPASILLLQRGVAERLEDGSSFREKVPGLMHYLAHAHKQRLGRRALLLLGLKFLVMRMQEENALLSYKTVMANIQRIPGCLEHEFPGYFAAGRLNWVVEAGVGQARQGKENRHG